MNILTFDIEEWYVEKTYLNNDLQRYQILDCYLKTILDLLDELNLKATFFCVGGLAREFPDVIRSISNRGHEIGCHSDKHIFLHSMNRTELMSDTIDAIHSLEDLTSRKVISYRAPAYSIGKNNKWALEVLAECGIERDSSIYPSNRALGGFPDFSSQKPCIVYVGEKTIKEFPISLTEIAGRQMAYSGGGYFRFFPLSFIKHVIRKTNYNMTYFHISDLEHNKYQLESKEYYEQYYKEPGTFKNRFVRMMKHSLGTKGAFEKMCDLVRSFDYINLGEADQMINWNEAKHVTL